MSGVKCPGVKCRAAENSYGWFIFDMIGKISLEHIRVGHEDLDHSFGKSFHVAFPDFFILALQLLEYLEALGQLCKDIYDAI